MLEHNALANYILGYMYHNKFGANNSLERKSISPIEISNCGAKGGGLLNQLHMIMSKVVKEQINYLAMLVRGKWPLRMNIEEKQKYFKRC